MKISVKLYGRYSTLARSSEITLTIPRKGEIRNIIDAFIQKFPEVAKDKPRIMITKNKQFAPPETTVSVNDIISIAPPLVAGG
jgi:molybdopterin converting factor small subunit